jgi:hypothetical protein
MNLLYGIIFASAMTTAPVEIVVLPLNPAAVDAKGAPLYVDDAVVRAKIPWLAGVGERLDMCMMSSFPPSLSIVYRPTVTAPHHATTNVLRCDLEKPENSLTCHRWSDSSVIFDEDPNRNFRVEANTTIEDALAVFRAFEQHRISFPPGMRNPMASRDLPSHIERIDKRGINFLIHFGSCGCGGSLTVERRTIGKESSFVVVKPPKDFCV